MSIASEIERLQGAKADIKSAIESKGVTVGDGTIDTYAAKIDEISGGGGVELDRYLKNATFTSLNIFGKSVVELNFDNLSTMVDLFYINAAKNTNTTVEHLTINCPNLITQMLRAFYCNSVTTYDFVLKYLTLNVNTKNCNYFQYAFSNLRALETIDGTPLDFSAVTTVAQMGAFNNCIALVDVRFVANSIPLSISFATCENLSTNTIRSIIEGLATVDTAQTLTLYSTVGAQLTDTQKATITAKNWTLVY